jgi:hypothetical protein
LAGILKALDRGTFELIYNLTFKPPVDDYDKDGAIWHALSECVRAKDFSVKFFSWKLRLYLEGLLSKQPRSFTAVAQIDAQMGARLWSSCAGRSRTFNGPVSVTRTGEGCYANIAIKGQTGKSSVVATSCSIAIAFAGPRDLYRQVPANAADQMSTEKRSAGGLAYPHRPTAAASAPTAPGGVGPGADAARLLSGQSERLKAHVEQFLNAVPAA